MLLQLWVETVIRAEYNPPPLSPTNDGLTRAQNVERGFIHILQHKHSPHGCYLKVRALHELDELCGWSKKKRRVVAFLHDNGRKWGRDVNVGGGTSMDFQGG